MSLGVYIITHSNAFLGWDIWMQPMTCRFYLHFIHEEFFEFLKTGFLLSCPWVWFINILETNLLLFGGIITPTGHRDKAVTENPLNVKMGQKAKPELIGGK